MAANKATVSVAASVLPDELKASVGGSIVYDLNDGNCFDELEFHTSWDWLMPVVEKIESMRDDFGNAHRVTIDMGNAVVENTSNNSSISIAILGSTNKIDATYHAVIEFINLKNK